VSPLHYAAREDHKEIVELLIAKGANVNAKILNVEQVPVDSQAFTNEDKEGKTPLDLAIQYVHTEIADLLRKHGGKTTEKLEAAGN
jgi:ankyrin repeat protein